MHKITPWSVIYFLLKPPSFIDILIMMEIFSFIFCPVILTRTPVFNLINLPNLRQNVCKCVSQTDNVVCLSEIQPDSKSDMTD